MKERGFKVSMFVCVCVCVEENVSMCLLGQWVFMSESYHGMMET